MRVYIYSLFALLFAGSLAAQTSQVVFGKNRVQFHRDFDQWLKYESDNFITYWYGEGRNIGQAVVQMAEYDFPYIQNILEHRINEKIQIIVYVDLTDLKQSNIGSDEVFMNATGQTKIAGNKVFVYFNGDHNDLRRQVREGIASVYMEAMLFGSNIQEIVQNAVLMNLPEWFKDGLIAYIGQSWSTELDNRLRQLLLSPDYEGFEEMATEHPRLAGQAFWYFIDQIYGQSTVSNLLYLTRINRSVESGFLYVLGNPYLSVIDNWENFFRQRYTTDLNGREMVTGQEISIKKKKRRELTSIKVSPDGQRVVYVLNEIGKYKVYLQEVATGKRQVIHKGGFRNALQATDYEYPLVAWNPSGQEIAVVYERRDVPKLLRYDVFRGKTVSEDVSTEIQRVMTLSYANPASLVFSAFSRGFSDVFVYYPATRQFQRVTTDFWDDVDAVAVQVRGRSGILFASNRQDTLIAPARLDTILPINTYDIFYYDLENKPGELVRVTHTPWANERGPAAIDSTYFGYLSDRSGIYNREVGYLEEYIHHYEQRITLHDGEEIILHADSSLTMLDTSLIDTIVVYPIIKERAVVHGITDYNTNILTHDLAPRVGRLVEVIDENGKDVAYLSSLDINANFRPRPTAYQLQRRSLLNQAMSMESELAPPQLLQPFPSPANPQNPAVPTPQPPPVEEVEVKVAEDYLFQTEFDDEAPASSPVNPAAPSPAQEAVTMIPRPQAPTLLQSAEAPDVYRFRPGLITPYRTTFRTDFVTFNVDNNLLFEGLDSYAASPDGFNTQPMSLLLKANFKDLFEDYVVEGGLRLPTTFNGTEYFLTFTNKKRRLDKFINVYRRNQRFAEEGARLRPWRRENNILMGQFGVRYPLDIFRSLRATGTIRRDRVMLLATDQSALSEPIAREQRLGLKLEYIFDNTVDVALNIKHGSRYKVFVEGFKSFEISTGEQFKFDFAKGYLGLAGIDFRHYQRLDRRSILAMRLAGAASFGPQKILYFLGGTDNWLFPSFNRRIPEPPTRYAFETLANNLRGFDLNIRNGNTYALMNAELRVPIFRYISERIRSPFFRNFQVVGFFDIGTAWSGDSPYSDENPLNAITFPDPEEAPNAPISARIVYFRDPIVMGYGVGARAYIFGYFLRFDYGWGVETREVLDPKLHISMGMDF